MSSTSAAGSRRNPQQARATLRRATILEVAARLFGELGYEGVTMTMVAEQAQASIGTLYDYFPDKHALALTLLSQYIDESDVHWAELINREPKPGKEALAELFVDGMLRFVENRPGYLPLFGAPIAYSRTPEQRDPVRRTIGKGLQAMNPNLSDDQAFLSGQVIVEAMKGLIAVYRQTAPEGRAAVVEEFKKLMRLYLAQTLS